jgi:F-type H+-transporting ATPase subunit epsilon
MAKLKLEIFTPEGVAYSKDVDMVRLPTESGEIGVFAKHAPMLTRVLHGEIVARNGGEAEHLAVGEGFAEVSASAVRVIVDMAIDDKQIDEGLVEEAVKKAQARLAEPHLSDEEVAVVQAALQKSMVKLKVKRRLRG